MTWKSLKTLWFFKTSVQGVSVYQRPQPPHFSWRQKWVFIWYFVSYFIRIWCQEEMETFCTKQTIMNGTIHSGSSAFVWICLLFKLYVSILLPQLQFSMSAEFWLSVAKEAWPGKKVDWDLETSVVRSSFKHGCYNGSFDIFLRRTHQLSDLSSCGSWAVCKRSQSSTERWKHDMNNHGFVLTEQLLGNLALVKANEWVGGAEASTNKLSTYLSMHPYLHRDV